MVSSRNGDVLTLNSSTTGNENTEIGSSNHHGEAQAMKKMLKETKVEGGKSAWAMTLETLSMFDGKHKKGDTVCGSFDIALKRFKELTDETPLECPYTPFNDFQSTQDDLYRAFVHWSHKEGSAKGENSYNVSKAFRRLRLYVDWMKKHCQNLNLRGSTMDSIAEIWKVRITHDEKGRVVLWLDVEALDLKKIKRDVPHNDTLRFMVWMSHLILFDQKAQENGIIVVQAIGDRGLMECMHAVSLDVGTKLDRLTIGVLPLKVEAYCMFNNPTWLNICVAILLPFMGKTIRKRIRKLKNKDNPQTYFEAELGSAACIPSGFAQLSGMAEKDIIAQTLERFGATGTSNVETEVMT